MNPGIFYLYEYNNTQKIRTVGFLKLTRYYQSCTLQLNARGIPVTRADTLKLCAFYLENNTVGSTVLADLPCANHMLNARLNFAECQFPDGHTLNTMDGFFLPLSGGRILAATVPGILVDAEKLVSAFNRPAAARDETDHTANTSDTSETKPDNAGTLPAPAAHNDEPDVRDAEATAADDSRSDTETPVADDVNSVAENAVADVSNSDVENTPDADTGSDTEITAAVTNSDVENIAAVTNSDVENTAAVTNSDAENIAAVTNSDVENIAAVTGSDMENTAPSIKQGAGSDPERTPASGIQDTCPETSGTPVLKMQDTSRDMEHPTRKESESPDTENKLCEENTPQEGGGNGCAENSSPETPRKNVRKIQRSDIAELPRHYWHLANNSFLLHGYHNYSHLLLVEEDGHHWLGVPGIYDSREARAARLFGFPQFTDSYNEQLRLSDDEKNDHGNFGYWCCYLK